jgi:hypothetical protein
MSMLRITRLSPRPGQPRTEAQQFQITREPMDEGADSAVLGQVTRRLRWSRAPF